MKKTIIFKLFWIITLVTIIVFGFVSCDLNEDESFPQGSPDSDFFGRWRDNASTWRQNTISANKLVYLFHNGDTYTMENLTWATVYNTGGYSDTYPSGVSITGTITTITIDSISSYGVTLKKGDTHTRTFYINSAKNQLWVPDNTTGLPYNKQ